MPRDEKAGLSSRQRDLVFVIRHPMLRALSDKTLRHLHDTFSQFAKRTKRTCPVVRDGSRRRNSSPAGQMPQKSG